MNEAMIYSSLKEEFGILPKGWIVQVETAGENAMIASLAAVKILTDKNYTSIILSANRPYSNLISMFKERNIDVGKIIAIDCISKSQNLVQEKNENVSYVSSVTDLEGISEAINKCAEKIEGNKFLFIDSITTMLIYNRNEIFVKFIHKLLTKMRVMEVSVLLISLENKKNRETKIEIAQLCDKVIKV